MTTPQDVDTQLRAELDRLRREHPEKAAEILNQALGRSPAGRSATTPTGPAYPVRTQHHSPIESESRFVRFCGWWDEVTCEKCGYSARTFDGLFEEREWIKDSIGGPKHYLKCSVAPLPELLKDAVAYIRYYRMHFCEKCIGAELWPLAQPRTETIDAQEGLTT